MSCIGGVKKHSMKWIWIGILGLLWPAACLAQLRVPPAEATSQVAHRLLLPTPSTHPADVTELTAPAMPTAYRFQELGIFCQWEVHIERAARLPVKFRLGEVQYVERLEGKGRVIE